LNSGVSDLNDHLKVVPTEKPLSGSFVVYEFDQKQLENQPIYMRIEKFVLEQSGRTWIGCALPPGNQRYNLLMDGFHLRAALEFLDQVTNESDSFGSSDE
jgi:hypothetical protein